MGVWRDLLTGDGVIDPDRWHAAVHAGQPVGACPCGGPLTGDTHSAHGQLWLTTTCATCGAETAAPQGRLHPRPRRRDNRRATPAADAAFRAAHADVEARRLGEHDP